MTRLIDINEIKHLLKLALPLLATQIVASLMFFTDTVMASRAGHVDMASVSIATGLWSPVIFAIQGLLISITPVVAQLDGNQTVRNKKNKMVRAMHQGGYLALLVCVFVLILFQFSHVPLQKLDLEPELYLKSQGYLDYVIWGLVPASLFFVLRGFCEGVSLTKPALVVSVVGLLANIPLNYIFVFGKFGAPELGGAGCGLATALVQWVSFISLLIYFLVSRKLKTFSSFSQFVPPRAKEIKQLGKIGIPISLSLLFESTLFAFTALFIAPLGAIAVAGHQVAFSYSAVVFMMPLSLSMAATIRIGYLRGFGDMDKLKTAIKTCFVLATLFGLIVMMITYFSREAIIAIYTSEPQVMALAASILVITAIYQLPDAIQVMSAGIFKGLKITKPLFYITFIAYWPIGFLFGYFLGRTDVIVPAMGPQGFWIGIVIGLTSASLMFIVKLRSTIKKLELAD